MGQKGCRLVPSLLGPLGVCFWETCLSESKQGSLMIQEIVAKIREGMNIRNDLLAGLVVALALIPEAMAFSIIAGLDRGADKDLRRPGIGHLHGGRHGPTS